MGSTALDPELSKQCLAISFRFVLAKVEMLDDLAAPSPTTTKGAQNDGWAAPSLVLSSTTACIARLSASARPMAGFALSSAKVRAVSSTAASESTAQCDTSSARIKESTGKA
jgi:hypothetical protein